jgi:hypothetical protein
MAGQAGYWGLLSPAQRIGPFHKLIGNPLFPLD